jgi:phosphoribosylformylglycinamidine synthase subunit PurQ / glutaminase
MKFGVVVFPGSNCDDDMVHVLGTVMKQDVVKIWHKDAALPEGLECVVLPGGFSYGDYLRSGAIARFSPVMQAVIEFANKGGLVWGICNGFQILCESGLLPGVLLRNEGQQFICKNVHLRVDSVDSPITNLFIKGEVLKIPIAHADGRFHADKTTLDALEANNQILFRYCNEMGLIGGTSNPNGAARDIAGICNAGRNVFGLMPHPERCAEEVLGNIDGHKMFIGLLESMIAA